MLAEREYVEPEEELTSDVIARLQKQIETSSKQSDGS